MTRDGIVGESPAVTVALCVSCEKLTSAPVAVRWIESTSGPGTTLWACPAHALHLTPGPIPDELDLQPLPQEQSGTTASGGDAEVHGSM